MFRKMRSKVLAAIAVIIVLVTTIITALFYWRSSEMVESNYVQNQYARIRQVGESCDRAFQEIYTLTVQASCDTALIQKVQEYQKDREEEVLIGIADVLREYAGRSSDTGAVCLIMPEERIIVTSKEYPIYEEEIEKTVVREISKAAEHGMTPVMMADPLRDSSDIVTFVSAVEDTKGIPLAYVMSNVEERTIYYKYLDDLEEQNNSKAVLLDQEGRIVSSGHRQEIGTQYDHTAFSWKKRIGVQESKDHKVLGIRYHTAFSGFCFWMEIEKQEVLADLKSLRYFLAGILVIAVCAAGILAVLITRTMYQPLKRLTETMEQVSDGDLDQRVEVTTKDEIGVLSEDFNQMLEHIRTLIDQLVKEEMLKKDAELNALQYQITPHFMYNTLNSIKYAALLKGEAEIGGLLDDFIELLQASINKKGTFVTVAEEVHFVENYLNLQGMRYEEKIQTTYEIRTEAEGCFLPRLILQPLVENAILHGLDLKRGRNHIGIGAYVEDGRLWLTVQDNGRGMTREQITKLLEGSEKKTRGLSGIGVANVRERLALYYGNAADIHYESSGEGTTVRICLPAYKEQDQYAL
ncbi:MAG: sensor histidine kinase [Dorea sp.]